MTTKIRIPRQPYAKDRRGMDRRRTRLAVRAAKHAFLID